MYSADCLTQAGDSPVHHSSAPTRTPQFQGSVSGLCPVPRCHAAAGEWSVDRVSARRAGLRPLGTSLGVGSAPRRVRCAMGASPCYGSPAPGGGRRRPGRAARLAGSLACPPTPAVVPLPRRLVCCSLAVERATAPLLQVLFRMKKVVMVATVGSGPKYTRSVALQGAGYATQTERMFSDRSLSASCRIFSLCPPSASIVPEYCHAACQGVGGLRSSAASVLLPGGVPPNPLLLGRFAADSSLAVVVVRPAGKLPGHSVMSLPAGPASCTMLVSCSVCGSAGHAVDVDPWGLYFCPTHAAQVRDQLALARRLGYCPN